MSLLGFIIIIFVMGDILEEVDWGGILGEIYIHPHTLIYAQVRGERQIRVDSLWMG
jgi:hypothetical protein